MANKTLKSLLHICALTAIKYIAEFGTFVRSWVMILFEIKILYRQQMVHKWTAQLYYLNACKLSIAHGDEPNDL